MGKLYSIYASKPRGERSQNILVSPESFSYLFANEKDDLAKANKVKAALMMISQDLKNTYNFPVIVVMPKPTYTTAYICLNTDTEADFLSEFGKYLTKISDAHTRYEAVSNQNTVEVKDMGPIYFLQADKMWEEKFSDRTFAQFKHDLFNGVIGSSNGNLAVAARLVLRINYEEDFSVIESRLGIPFSLLLERGNSTVLSSIRPSDQNLVIQLQRLKTRTRCWRHSLNLLVPHKNWAEVLSSSSVKPPRIHLALRSIVISQIQSMLLLVTTKL